MERASLVAVALLAAVAGSVPAASHAGEAKPAPAAAPAGVALEPKAVDILKAASARLAAARTMSFTAVAAYESPSRLGPPLVYATISEVTLQRPDKLRVITPGDGPATEFYYDGKVMMAYAPAEDLVAVAAAPPTIDAAMKAALDSTATYFPFADVIVADPYADIAPDLKKLFYIGRSQVVGGTTTDILGIVTDHLFGQMWIGADDKLPRAYRVTYLADPSRLRQEVVFSKWRLDGQVDAGAFTSTKAASAKKMQFARPDPMPPAEPAKGAKSDAPAAAEPPH